MGEHNFKNNSIDHSNSIKKSNELSIAELNFGLNLNQTQLLAFAIFSTQQDGKTTFRKHEFQKKFNIEQYRTEDAYKDSEKILDLKASVKDFELDYFSFTNIFSDMIYKEGKFIFEWNPKILEHILDLKNKYVLTDLRIASKFRSNYSWTLYEYLKAHYGRWYKYLTKEELFNLFGVSDVKSYQKAITNFKSRVLDIAINEINKYTELSVWYDQEKRGKNIIGFTLQWSAEKRKNAATQKQISYIHEIINAVNQKTGDYISIKNTDNFEKVRTNIVKVQAINEKITDNLSSEEASDLIKEVKEYYNNLENILYNDKEKRDTSVYFNWIKGEN